MVSFAINLILPAHQESALHRTWCEQYFSIVAEREPQLRVRNTSGYEQLQKSINYCAHFKAADWLMSHGTHIGKTSIINDRNINIVPSLSPIVSTADLRMEGAQVAFAIFIPIILLLIIIIGIYLCFSK